MNKLVVLSSRFPYPLEKGDKLRLYYQILDLSKTFAIHLISLTNHDIDSKSLQVLESICQSVKVFNLNTTRKYAGLALNVFDKKPFQVRYFYDADIKRELKKCVKSINPDLIYCQLIRMVPYALALEGKKILDYMDSFSMIMKREAEQSSNIFSRKIFELEAKRVKNYEKKVSTTFDKCIIISSQDKALMKDGEDIEVISNGVDSEYYAMQSQEKDIDIIFAGNMGYRPNISAAKYLINNIVEAQSFKVVIAGARPSKEVLDLANEQVEVTGWVDDIRSWYQRSKIFVAPIFGGAGQQNKILQAMAMGVPCITTPGIQQAIKAIHYKHLLVAKTAEEFRASIDILLNDTVKAAHIAEEARRFVVEEFNWKNQNDKLVHIMNGLIN